MHALVAAVLLRMARLNALDADAEAQPLDRQLGEIESPLREAILQVAHSKILPHSIVGFHLTDFSRPTVLNAVAAYAGRG